MSSPNDCSNDKEEWEKFVEDFSHSESEYGNEIIEDFVSYMSEEPGKSAAKKVKKDYTYILSALLSTVVNTKREMKDWKELFEKTHTENIILFEFLKSERKAYKLEREELLNTLKSMQVKLDQLGVTIGDSGQYMADKLNIRLQRIDNKGIGNWRMMVEMKDMMLECSRMLSTIMKIWRKDIMKEKENVDPAQPKITAVLGKRVRE